ncbi:hypothetical protein B0H13DRAFT_1874339 [Mycena leptocephala]|nr:hypothetical protein B0H13DRAFT_1874339 [Mycena leptocephala]
MQFGGRIGYFTEPTTPMKPLLSFLATQSLRSLTFSGASNSVYNCLQTPVSWGNLTNLKIEYVYHEPDQYASARTRLRQCTMLQTCELTICGTTMDLSEPVQQFCLPQLSHFTISNPHSMPVDGFSLFGHMDLPSLHSLNLHTALMGDLACIPSAGTLVSFKLRLDHIANEDVLQVLRNMPSLQELQLEGEPIIQPGPHLQNAWEQVAWDKKILAHLTPTPDGIRAVVCPQLRCIELLRFFSASDQAILEFVQSRTGPQLQNVAHLSRMDVIADGLVLSLTYADSFQVVPSDKVGIYVYVTFGRDVVLHGSNLAPATKQNKRKKKTPETPHLVNGSLRQIGWMTETCNCNGQPRRGFGQLEDAIGMARSLLLINKLPKTREIKLSMALSLVNVLNFQLVFPARWNVTTALSRRSEGLGEAQAQKGGPSRAGIYLKFEIHSTGPTQAARIHTMQLKVSYIISGVKTLKLVPSDLQVASTSGCNSFKK